MPPVAPMLAKAAAELPAGERWAYEPKWDGFRTIAFRDGPEVELGSRNERPLTRYFPELVAHLRSALPQRCVVDGEIVIAGKSGLDFDALLQRIHPASSRVNRLATETPASLVVFDLLALEGTDLRPAPFEERRRALETSLAEPRAPLHVTPMTVDRARALDWFERFEGAGLDGVVAKSLDLVYREGERVMVKVKHERRAECVVAGYRVHKAGGVGSLLLGLYDEAGTLHHVGVASSFTARRRAELLDELAPYRLEPDADHPWKVEGAPAGRRPGAPSRWSAQRDTAWEPLAPVLVCEVTYGQLQGDRFRHAVSFQRWRPDREPRSCEYSQLEVAVPVELSQALGA